MTNIILLLFFKVKNIQEHRRAKTYGYIKTKLRQNKKIIKMKISSLQGTVHSITVLLWLVILPLRTDINI